MREVRERIPDALRVEALTPRASEDEHGGDRAAGGGDLADAYAEWLALTGRGRDDRLVDAFRAALAAAEGGGD